MPLNPEKKFLLLLVLFTGMLISCDSKRIYDENVIVENNSWNSSAKMKFEVPVSDTGLRYNLYLKVRNAPEYPYSNLFLFLNSRFPDGRIARDTLELTLADYDGRWLGSGIGSVKFSKFMVRHGFRFRQKGTYVFELEQAMRVRVLKGIRDIGLRVEKQ
ncbi:MAG: gliding motility lipoprotein GldH [Bacteroidota bacterium]